MPNNKKPSARKNPVINKLKIKKKLNSSLNKLREAILLYNSKREEFLGVMDKICKQELRVVGSFEKYAVLVKNIKNLPAINEEDADTSSPRCSVTEIGEASRLANILLKSLDGANEKTVAGFAAAGPLSSADSDGAIASGEELFESKFFGDDLFGSLSAENELCLDNLVSDFAKVKNSDWLDIVANLQQFMEGTIRAFEPFLRFVVTFEKVVSTIEGLYEDYLADLLNIDNISEKVDFSEFSDDEQKLITYTDDIVQQLLLICATPLISEDNTGNDENSELNFKLVELILKRLQKHELWINSKE